jgi:hypothetical protein
MRAIAFGLLLAVFLVGYHRQQQHPQPSDIQRTSQHSPKKTVAPVAQIASAEQKESAYQKTKEYLWKAIGPEFLAAWILVFAAGIGLYVTWRTAKAALLNARAVISVERPWLVVSLTQDERDSRKFVLVCLNQGNTPAKILALSAHRCFVDRPDNLPVPPDYSHFVQIPDLRLIVHGDSFPIGCGIAPEHVLAEEKDRRELVYQAREFLVYYGNVVYRDTLYPETSSEGQHETRWCFVYQPTPNLTKAALAALNPTGNFVRSGPAEYNGYT